VCHRAIEILAQGIAEKTTRERSLLRDAGITKNGIVKEVAAVYLEVCNLGTKRYNKAVCKAVSAVPVVPQGIVTGSEDIGTCAYCRKPSGKFTMPASARCDPS
jgi:hypothetical protein